MTFSLSHFVSITTHAGIWSERQQLFQNHWTLHTKLLNWSSSPLNAIHIFERSTKKSVMRTKKIYSITIVQWDELAAEAQTIAKHTVARLKTMRSKENCHLFWEDVKQKATKLDVDTAKLPRKRIAQTRIEEFFGRKAAPKYDNDVILHYRTIYFESLDCIINAIEDRFDQEDFRTCLKLGNPLFKVAKGNVSSQE